ncbi:MAG: porin family protein [Flavobacterium sp.]
MKKQLILIILILLSLQSFSQFKSMFAKDPMINLENFDMQRVHWGYFLGFNFYDFKWDYLGVTEDVESNGTTGFNVGLVGNLRISNHIDLRFEPGLYYTQRNLRFPDVIDQFEALREVKSTYIHFPLLVKFSAKRTGNIKPYLVGGVSTSLNLSSNADAEDDNLNNRFRMIKWTNNYEFGFGIDLYFEYFKFSPSIRGVFSLNDELIRDNDVNSPWTGNIQSMKTRAVFLNFTFH